MFFVINKEKIYAYAVSAITVIMLFCMANVMRESEAQIETSANIVNEITQENKTEKDLNNI